MLSNVTNGDAPLVEVAPDGQRHVLSQLADGQGPGVEAPVGIAEASSGSLLVLEQFGGSPQGEVIEVAPDGTRAILRDLSSA